MKKVLVFGTFDFLHSGHLHFLLQAKELGDHLVVAVAHDNTVQILKGKSPIHTQEERKALIQHLDCVDEVVSADDEIGNFKVIQKVMPDIVAVGYDQERLSEYLSDHKYAYDLQFEIKMISQYSGGERKSSQVKGQS